MVLIIKRSGCQIWQCTKHIGRRKTWLMFNWRIRISYILEVHYNATAFGATYGRIAIMYGYHDTLLLNRSMFEILVLKWRLSILHCRPTPVWLTKTKYVISPALSLAVDEATSVGVVVWGNKVVGGGPSRTSGEKNKLLFSNLPSLGPLSPNIWVCVRQSGD